MGSGNIPCIPALTIAQERIGALLEESPGSGSMTTAHGKDQWGRDAFMADIGVEMMK